MRPRVFISYSHKDRALLDSLVAQLKVLENAGLLDVWVDTRIDAGEKWYPEIEAAMNQAAVAVCLVSEHFLSSDFCTKEEVPFLLKRAERDGLLIIPVLLSDCAWYAYRWIEERQMLPGEGQSVRTHFPSNPAAAFSKVAKRVYDKLNDPNFQPPKTHLAWPAIAPERIDLMRLPETGAALFGREDELKVLDQAWSSGEKPGEAQTRVLAFVAYGGVGKSTLVNHWLREMQRDHFRGATRVFGWSFYSQGAREEGMASADAFIDAALRFFGDPDPASGSPWDKGERLASLVGVDRTLLVLDGMEPLQSGHTFDKGKLRDPALESLLRGLARGSGGLCLITTREPLPDLTGRPGLAAYNLEQITPEAGRALLRTARVVGTDAELETLAGQFGPHALAVSLLGVYLHEKDPLHGIGPANEIEQMPGKESIDRVLAGFEQWLADTAELEVLRMLGLFDRPADEGCLGALRARPAIPGLTDRVVELSDADWDLVLSRLEKLRLFHVRQSDSGRQSVDAHPLIREHFARQLRDQHPDTWQAAHLRLYEHLRDSTPDLPQLTLADLQPLYQAVAHGCKAGMHQEVCEAVYRDRILRGEEAYSANHLGAYSSDLSAVACFFETQWSIVEATLDNRLRAWILNNAGFYLRALGRTVDAREAVCASITTEEATHRTDPGQIAIYKCNLSELQLTLGEVGSAVVSAKQSVASAQLQCNLSELELTLGEVGSAVVSAKQSVASAQLQRDRNVRLYSLSTLADALHQSGKRGASQQRFQDVEESQGKFDWAVSLQGFRHCSLCLAEAERAAWQHMLQPETQNSEPRTLAASCLAVERRAAQTLTLAERQRFLLDIALDHLTAGRAAIYRAILERSEVESAKSEIDQAVDGLHRAGMMEHLPRGFLTRAWLCSLEGDPDGCRANLDLAWEIAECGPMRLFMADIHLYRARLFRDKEELKRARLLIEQCSYWRRREELEDAEEAAKGWA